MKTEQEKAREHLQDLLNLNAGLTEWELEFVESVSKWTDDLTDKQIAMIYKIYERRC